MQTITVPASINQLNYINEKLSAIMVGRMEPLLLKTELIVEELLANICTHGYAGKSGIAEFACGQVNLDDKAHVMIAIKDHGEPYDPFLNRPDPNIDAPLEERQLGGLGLHLIKEIASHYCYAHIDDWNMVTIYLEIKD